MIDFIKHDDKTYAGNDNTGELDKHIDGLLEILPGTSLFHEITQQELKTELLVRYVLSDFYNQYKKEADIQRAIIIMYSSGGIDYKFSISNLGTMEKPFYSVL